MKKQISYIGGFAATNTGTIDNSYSLVQVGNKDYIAGGFVGQNNGTVEHSFCETKLKNLAGGFSGAGTDVSSNCYFFHNEETGSKKVERLRDKERGKNWNEVENEKQAERLEFDIENIWEFNKEKPVLKFNARNWMADTESLLEETDEDSIFSIKTANELFDFAEKVNSGYAVYRDAYVRLENDLDLDGKEFIPIGESLRRSFKGVFDGCGHMISNYKITDPQHENKGFFGFLEGKVFNLTVDCIIQGSGCIGGLVAQNVSGTIGCCAAIVTIDQKKNKESTKNLSIGGLVGLNTGTIYESYAAGHISCLAIIVFWPYIAVATGVLVCIGTMIYINLPSSIPDKEPPVFNKIPEDVKQKPIEDEEDVSPRTDSNFVSFQFNKEINIDLDAGTCTLDYKNPGESNHNTVVELQITDTVAKEAMGGTGRDAEEQADYEARADYDPEAYRVTIGQSELVLPGYQVTALALSDFAKQNMAPGSYEAVIMIYPYEMNTNNKAMLESQLPVTIVVQ